MRRLALALCLVTIAACGPGENAATTTSTTTTSPTTTSTTTATTTAPPTTTTTSVATGDDDWSPVIRDAYLLGCESESPGGTFCACTLEALEERYSEEEFATVSVTMDENDPPEEFLEVVFLCLDEMDLGEPGDPGDDPDWTWVSVFLLESGDCFDDSSVSTSEVPVIDCDLPHDNEIYFAYEMTDAVYPGEAAALESANLLCIEEFETFVGSDYLESELTHFAMTPTAASWAQGDRVVLCMVYAADFSQLVGTMEGSGR